MNMITKEAFCKVLALIQEQDAINDEVGASLQKVCGSVVAFGTENKYQEALMLVLREALPDKYGYVEWWLYEAPSAGYHVWLDDGSKEWNLESPEALYDFIINNCR